MTSTAAAKRSSAGGVVRQLNAFRADCGGWCDVDAKQIIALRRIADAEEWSEDDRKLVRALAARPGGAYALRRMWRREPDALIALEKLGIAKGTKPHITAADLAKVISGIKMEKKDIDRLVETLKAAVGAAEPPRPDTIQSWYACSDEPLRAEIIAALEKTASS